MANAKFWVGLDVGVDVMACCVVDDRGSVVAERLIPAQVEALRPVLKPIRRRIGLIALEAGSTGTHLSRTLVRQGYPVSLLDTRRTHKFLSIVQNKTDKNDARGLAEIARVGREFVGSVRLKSLSNQNLRSLLGLRQKLIRMRVAAEGIIRSLLRINGGELKRVTSGTMLKKSVTRELKRLRKRQKIDLFEEITPLLDLSQSLRSYLSNLDRKLRLMAHENQVCRRLMTIPGVGPICALSFYSAIDEPIRFKRNADVGAYLGMTPRVRQSGNATSRLRISRMGNRMTRAHLVMAASSHMRSCDSSLRDWGIQLRERAGAGRARVGVARKLAVLMLAIWKSGNAFEARPPVTSASRREAAGLETAAEPVDGNDPACVAGQACRNCEESGSGTKSS